MKVSRKILSNVVFMLAAGHLNDGFGDVDPEPQVLDEMSFAIGIKRELASKKAVIIIELED